ncbi:hypothetical protein HDV05_004893 [Chytridiales sp. JEL 0842]|nr:hypothetical protein HDV05_004893 [Chytridiales sp. JEL 0842]
MAGPGSLISVGYMDPYRLLFVILLANVIAVLLQSLSLRIGIVTGRDLAQLCRRGFHPIWNIFLWIVSELAIIATDLAEVIGTAIAFKLLFGMPIWIGVLLTSLDTLLILAGWNKKHLRIYEAMIFGLILVIGVCFSILIDKSKPNWAEVFEGYLPSTLLVTNGDALFIGLGILGATVMPHNLFLHSALVSLQVDDRVSYFPMKSRGLDQAPLWKRMLPSWIKSKNNAAANMALSTSPSTATLDANLPVESATIASETPASVHPWVLRPASFKSTLDHAIRTSNIDSFFSLTYALIVNSFILIVSAANFYNPAAPPVATLEDAHSLLKRDLGPVAAVLFAVALWVSGQCSTITGTLAGQVVMEGFLGDPDKLDAGLLDEDMREVRTKKDDKKVVGDGVDEEAQNDDVDVEGRQRNVLRMRNVRGRTSLEMAGADGVDHEETVEKDLELLEVYKAQTLAELNKKSDGTAIETDFSLDKKNESVLIVESVSTDANGGASPTAKGKTLPQYISAIPHFFRDRPWARRLLTRSCAVVPALITSLTSGQYGLDRLLVISQVTLSALLPFALWPLVWFASRDEWMTVRYLKKASAGTEVSSLDAPQPQSQQLVEEEVRMDSEGAVELQVEATADAERGSLSSSTSKPKEAGGYEDVSYASNVVVMVLSVIAGIFITGLNVYMLAQLTPEDFASGGK